MQDSILLPLIILLITVFSNILLALLALKNNPRSATNKIFSLLSTTISVWLFVNFVSLFPSFLGIESLYWMRMTIFFATPLSALFFLLANTLPKHELQLSKTKQISVLIASLIVMVIAISPFAFTGVEIKDNVPKPISGPGMLPFTILSTLFSFFAVFVLIRKIRRSVGLEKDQFRYVMLGILLMLGLIIGTVLFPVILFNNNTFVQFMPLYTLIFLGMTTYAIVKHRLLDIRKVVARTVSFTVLIAYVGLVYSLLFTFLLSLFPGITIDVKTLAIATVLTFITAITFQPIRRFLEKITDTIFYKHRYSTSKLLYDLALIMASTLRLEHLTHKLLKELLSQMHVSRGALVLLAEDGGIYEVAHEGYTFTPEFDEKDIKELVDYHDMLIIEELPEGNYKNILRKLDATCVVYLSTEGRYMGLLALGEKLSGDIYTSEDLRLLKIFAPEAAVAIQNAQSYEEIHRFSLTLQEEVNRATKELLIANKKLESLDKLKDEFLSLASHELRTPMTAIKSYLWMVLEGRVGKISEKQKDYLDIAYKSTDRLIALVNDMLNISRIESGKLTPDLKAVKLNQLVDDVVVEMTLRATELGVGISVVSPTLPEVWADLNKIKEVLINLIGNSLKFTPRDGKITIKLQKKDNFVETSVSDTGAGIKTEDLPKLFQKFSMVGSSLHREKNTKGTGLGLYLSKLIVELHGGRIWAQSQGEGKGATLTFSLKVFEKQ